MSQEQLRQSLLTPANQMNEAVMLDLINRVDIGEWSVENQQGLMFNVICNVESLEVLKALVNKGFPLDFRDEYGFTMREVAEMHGDNIFADYIAGVLGQGADADPAAAAAAVIGDSDSDIDLA